MIKTWRERLDWGGERSPTGPQIRKAMQQEITELRREVRKQTDRADRNKAAAKTWRAHASRYQKQLIARPVVSFEVDKVPAKLREKNGGAV
jgi:hypothetical protein